MSEYWNTKRKNNQAQIEQCILVGVVHPNQTINEVNDYLDELEFLALTAGAHTKKRYIQSLKKPNPKTYIGKGKLEEIERYILQNEKITTILFDDDLTSKQNNILEKSLKIKIIDRSSLILDIFANNAKTAQAKTQVELAQMQYLLPRLRGLWTHLERQRGGIGMRGPGEMEIETDRRIVRKKISYLKNKLETIAKQQKTQRKKRGEFIRVSLVGYTNAGKSSLMNKLSKSNVFADNKLFATLDTTVRKVVIDNFPFLLSDTVGFIRKLPHHLIESFKSTLAETRESDIIIHIIDMSHPNMHNHIMTVNQTLEDLNLSKTSKILVFNKLDLYKKNELDKLLDRDTKNEIMNNLTSSYKDKYDENSIFISVETNENIDILKNTLKHEVKKLLMTRYPKRL